MRIRGQGRAARSAESAGEACECLEGTRRRGKQSGTKSVTRLDTAMLYGGVQTGTQHSFFLCPLAHRLNHRAQLTMHGSGKFNEKSTVECGSIGQRLDPGQNISRAIDADFPSEALKAKRLKDIRIEFSHVPRHTVKKRPISECRSVENR